MNQFIHNKYLRRVTFGILPLFLFITAFVLKDAGGPYYLNYYDPGYVYLVNSINLMEFQDIGHTDHPGTTLQVFGAVVLKIIFAGKTDAEVLDIVFSNPEMYLNILNKCLVLFNCIALYCLGLFVYRQTSNIFLSILIQLSPFISFEIFYGLVIVSPENFLILSVLCLSAALFYIVYNKDSENHLLALSLIFGLICGFGSVSKLNFLPVCILPLIVLKGFRYKMIFTGAAVLTFLIFFSPALSKISKFAGWAGNLAMNTGIHGKTDLSMFDFSMYMKNIALIFSKDIFFAIIYLLILTVLVITAFIRRKEEFIQSSVIYLIYLKERKILFAILITMTFQTMVVAKNYLPYAQYYIIPSLMFSITGLAFLISFSLRSFKVFQNADPSKVFVSAIIIVFLFSVYEISKSIKEAEQFRDEAIKINSLVKEYLKSETVISSAGTANENSALALCLMYGYSGKREPVYRQVFSKKSSSDIFHNFWEDKLFSISDTADIERTISGKEKIVVQLMPVTSIEKIIKMLKDDYNINVKDWKLILKNQNQESVYEIYL